MAAGHQRREDSNFQKSLIQQKLYTKWQDIQAQTVNYAEEKELSCFSRVQNASRTNARSNPGIILPVSMDNPEGKG